MQKTVQQFTSACSKAQIFVDNEMPLGQFHDFLMLVKGAMTQRMIDAHNQQLEEMKKQCAEATCDADESINQQILQSGE